MWSDAAHRLDLTGALTAIKMPVRMWLVAETFSAGPPPGAADLASMDVRLANSILEETRTGIELDTLATAPLPLPTEELNDDVLSYRATTDVGFPCADLQSVLEAEATAVPVFNDYVIHVFYYPGKRKTDLHGEWCKPIDGKRGAVIIWLGERLPTVLAHELGHVLGVKHYCSTSAGCVIADSMIATAGHDAANLLASGPNLAVPHINDWAGSSRSWLTVGQIFQMNWYALTFLEDARVPPYDDDAAKVLPPGSTLYCYGSERCPPEQTGAIP